MAKRSNTAHGDARGEKYAPAPADHSLAGRLESVRQLTNEIQRIVARAEDGTTISPEHLSPEFQPTAARATRVSASALPQNVSLADAVEDLERRMIAEALRKHNGNISRAARELGLTRRGLQLKLGRYHMAATA
ncbi:MAG TPA: helix-turn-helix domain-containing protein [Pyrinomonadaceae bacterium]